jgi:hypothetical protein
VLTEGGIVEIQATAEQQAFTEAQFGELLAPGESMGAAALFDAQRAALGLMSRRISRGSRLVLASHNRGKLREIAELVAPFGVLVSAVDLGLPEPEETEADFAGNARLKALAAARAAALPALADDSGFCVAALGGAPGVLSARWAGPDKDFAAAMRA